MPVGAVAGQAQHQLDEVDAVDLLGHRMLDLQAGVHLEERRLLADRVVDELDGARRAVVDGRGERPGRLVQLPAHGIRKRGSGRLLDDLLVAALQRAVAVADHGDAAVARAEQLHLHVAGRPHQALEEHAGRAEVLLAEPGDPVEGLAHLVERWRRPASRFRPRRRWPSA